MFGFNDYGLNFMKYKYFLALFFYIIAYEVWEEVLSRQRC